MKTEEANEPETKEQFDVSCRVGILRQKTKIVTIKLSAPKEIFIIPDALSKRGSFQSLEAYMEEKLQVLLSEYLKRAEEVLARASELTKTNKR